MHILSCKCLASSQLIDCVIVLVTEVTTCLAEKTLYYLECIMTNRSFFSETPCVVVCSNFDTTGINPSEICFGDNDKRLLMALWIIWFGLLNSRALSCSLWCSDFQSWIWMKFVHVIVQEPINSWNPLYRAWFGNCHLFRGILWWLNQLLLPCRIRWRRWKLEPGEGPFFGRR